jgi:DNA-binding transcriptional MerR regulator
MKIGELARLTGVSVDASGYRQYSPDTVTQVQFLRTAQALGFSLQEIADVMPALTQGNLPLGEVQQLMQAKLHALDQQIKHLQALRQQLLSTLGSFKCDAHILLNPKDLTRPKAKPSN